MDQDWADETTLTFALDLFRSRDLPVTVFATGASAVLEVPGPRIEVGIHPDFFRNADHAAHISWLKALYPRATAVRSHGLFEYAGLMETYVRQGLRTDCSQQLYLCSHLRPYLHPSGLIRLPMYWEDDDYFSLNPDWDPAGLWLRTPGIKCLDFHPIHLRLNTRSAEDYAAFKRQGIFPELTQTETATTGVYAFFLRVLEVMDDINVPVLGLEEVCRCL